MDVSAAGNLPMQVQIAMMSKAMDMQAQSMEAMLSMLENGGDTATFSAEALAMLAAATQQG
jgi:hypothetical protein